METVLIILAIVWVVIPILAKSKQKQAKEQAERELLARQRAAQAAALQQAERDRAARQVRTQPLTPSVRLSQPSYEPSTEGSGSLEGRSGAVLQGELAHDVAVNLQEASSSLTQLQATEQHVISASSDSGHAHEETSMSGINASCPPDKAHAAQVAAALSSSESAFLWDPANVRSGLVLAEILGPCVAMRE